MNWATFIMALVGPIARRVLVSLGIGMVTYAGVSAAVDALLSQAKSAWVGGMSGLAAGAIQLVAMSGTNTALGIIAGGIVARVTMMTLKRLQVL